MGETVFVLALMFAVGGSVTPSVLPGHDKFVDRETCEVFGAAALTTRFNTKAGSPTAPIAGYACFVRPK
jgi:hypothetical protein